MNPHQTHPVFPVLTLSMRRSLNHGSTLCLCLIIAFGAVGCRHKVEIEVVPRDPPKDADSGMFGVTPEEVEEAEIKLKALPNRTRVNDPRHDDPLEIEPALRALPKQREE